MFIKVLYVLIFEEFGFDVGNYEMKVVLIVNVCINNFDKDVWVCLVMVLGKVVVVSEVVVILIFFF